MFKSMLNQLRHHKKREIMGRNKIETRVYYSYDKYRGQIKKVAIKNR